jgi:UTP:GlnB (protein PII) uridylyltransferase
MHGEVIPTDLVKVIFNTHSASIVTSFKNGADQFLIEISKFKDLNKSEVSQLRGKLITIINNSVKQAVSASSKSIKSIVDEFTVKKEVGEHE